MSYLKELLEELTKDDKYYAEMVDNIAEIYIQDEPKPVLMIEEDSSIFYLNFRCDLLSNTVAQMTYDITMIDEDIEIGQDFFSTPETGIVSGEDALTLYLTSIIQTFEMAQIERENTLMDNVYVVQSPIYAYGNGNKDERKNKMQKLWGTDLE